MNKNKVISALGLCGAVLSSSLTAMEIEKYNLVNGLSDVKRDVFLRICNVIGSDRHGSQEDNKIKNLIGMCFEHYRWKNHNYFLINRKRLAGDIIRYGRNYLENYTPNAHYSDGTPVQWKYTHIENIDDVLPIFQEREFSTSDKSFTEQSSIVIPMIKGLFVLNKLGKYAEHFLETAILFFSRTWQHQEAEIADIIKWRCSAHDFAIFFATRGVANSRILEHLWDKMYMVDELSTDEKRREFTFIIKEHEIDINKVYVDVAGRCTILDMQYMNNPLNEENINFLRDKCRAKRLEQLPGKN
ncbi:hypothetical protein FACS1894122_02760 [Alphaproteobacteria bacterium]|nr:hypothetical protein FACS1894122_02760 [Alphaproteobacteria bacterium]